jgi:hypothetical protein
MMKIIFVYFFTFSFLFSFTPDFLFSSELLHLDPKKENILVLHSWHDILWDRLWGKGIDNTLGDDYNLIRYDFDALRQDDTELKRRATTSFELAEKYNVAGVIFGDDKTLNYAGPLFEGTKYPGVYLGINFSPRKYLNHSKASNITGLLERPLYKTAIKKLFKIFPTTPNKVLLLSDTPLGQEDITDLAKLFQNSKSIKIFNTTLDFQVQETWEKWQEAVIDAPKNGYDLIMVGSRYILKDKNGVYQEPSTDVLQWMSKNSAIPFFGFYEDGAGPEFHAGGWILNGVAHGEMAGKIMYDILKKGKNPSDINPVFYNFGEYIFSRSLLKKYKLTLPEDIEKNVIYIEDKHDLWDFKKYSFDKGDKAWTPSNIYRK